MNKKNWVVPGMPPSVSGKFLSEIPKNQRNEVTTITRPKIADSLAEVKYIILLSPLRAEAI